MENGPFIDGLPIKNDDYTIWLLYTVLTYSNGNNIDLSIRVGEHLLIL